jgi:hypothetical protein
VVFICKPDLLCCFVRHQRESSFTNVMNAPKIITNSIYWNSQLISSYRNQTHMNNPGVLKQELRGTHVADRPKRSLYLGGQQNIKSPPPENKVADRRTERDGYVGCDIQIPLGPLFSLSLNFENIIINVV